MNREDNVNDFFSSERYRFEETSSFRNNKFVKKIMEKTLQKLDSILEKQKEK